MSTVRRVLRDEGWRSAVRRASERGAEALSRGWRLARGWIERDDRAPLLNACGMPVAPRLGGLPIQLATRLAAEAAHRTIALYEPGCLTVRSHARRCVSLEAALDQTGARTLHVEGTAGFALDALLALPAELRLILSLHDTALLQAPAAQRAALFARCAAVVYPSSFLAHAYGVPGSVIAPATPALAPRASLRPEPRRIAYVGAAKRHKGAALLPALLDASAPGSTWHVFGGGDDERLLAALRPRPDVHIHGYVRAACVPTLLRRHRIGVAVLPSLVPESYSLALSECWLAGVPAVAFDLGALGDRIRAAQGPQWLAPADSGPAGIVGVLQQWHAGLLQHPPLPQPADARQAAAAMRSLYVGLDR